jgi:ABC-type dipeptide/oligopeptide/nickel transport system permease component
MVNYILRRLLLVIPSMLAVFTITFFLMHATPGGPWDRTGRPLPEHVVERLNEKYGLDKPVWRQYTDFLWGAISRGDLGESYSHYGQSVVKILVSFFPVSLQLGALAMGCALVAGIGLGVLSAINHNTWIDYLATFLSIFGVSTPNYVVANLLVIALAVKLGWLPTGGWEGLLDKRVIIPTISLALPPMALIARYTRASMLDVLQQDYIRTARSKGLRERIVLGTHALRNAMIPVATAAGVAFASVVTGSFFVESTTKVPGIGRYFVKSVSGRDYPVIMGTTLLYALVVMLMNLVVDILYAFLDPRVRYD